MRKSSAWQFFGDLSVGRAVAGNSESRRWDREGRAAVGMKVLREDKGKMTGGGGEGGGGANRRVSGDDA